jgi:hypothetical protein
MPGALSKIKTIAHFKQEISKRGAIAINGILFIIDQCTDGLSALWV